MNDDVAFLGAAELGRRFAARTLSPVEVVDALLARIARHDGTLNAFVAVWPERARAEAAAAEAEIARGAIRGPLHGVPIALKDLFDVEGLATEAGSKVFAGRLAARDAAVVERLRAAGMPLLGKLNLHEVAFGLTTNNPHTGATRNPWNTDRVAGGSSGGSAVALAAGLAPLALGTDTGGSIRVPAAACGVVGLKPTFGRVSRRGVVPLAWTLDHTGPMARSVEGTALLFDAIAGPDAEDPWCATRPFAPVGAPRADLGGLTIGVPRGGFAEGLDADVARAVAEAVGVLEGLGARRVEPVAPELAPLYTAQHAIIASEAAAVHARDLRARPGDYGPDVRRGLVMGALLPAADLVQARRVQAQALSALLRMLETADVLVTAALPSAAPPIGAPLSREPAEAWNRLIVPFSFTGLPAVSIPCGFDRDGLPVGLQIAGRPFDEATVLRVAAAFERATTWHTPRPPGFA